MEKMHLEGVVVHVFPFQDYDRIFTVFSPFEGLVKFIIKGGASSKKGGLAATMPLTVLELIYKRGRGDLYLCYETSVLDHQFGIRQNLETLGAACEMLKSINATQMPGKASPDLYRLLLAYLKKLPSALDPATLYGSFYLKTLRHEGLWNHPSQCDLCGIELADSYFAQGSAFCYQHAPSNALSLTISEREIFELLAFSRDLSLLASLPMTASLTHKIEQLFKICIS